MADYSQLQIQPVQKSQAPPGIQALFEYIQDTMGIPWPPANWRTYALYPAAMQLFWNYLKPVVATDLLSRHPLQGVLRHWVDQY